MAMELFALECIEIVLHLRNASLNGLNSVKANNVDVHALIKERAQVLAARELHGGAAQIHQR